MRKSAKLLASVKDIQENFMPWDSQWTRLQTVCTSAVKGLLYPSDSQHLNLLGEGTSYYALLNIHRRLSSSESGFALLTDKPRLRTPYIELSRLLEYKEGTLGHQYGKFLKEFGLNHDERPLVQHIGDIELAYVYQRYKEVHDLLHVVFGRGISVYDEIVIKWFEFAQSELASTALAAWFGPLRLTSAQISQLFAEDVPEVLRRAKQSHFFMEVYYEKHFDQDIEDFRRWFFQANR